MPTKRPKTPTLAAIGEALNITVRRVSELKKSGMPTSTISAAERWRDAQKGKQEGRTDSAERLRQKRIALLHQQERKVRIETDEKERRLISRDDAEATIYACTYAAKMALWSLRGTLPGELAGLDEVGCCRILDREFRRILDMLADGHREFWDSEIGKKCDSYLETLQAERAKTEGRKKP